MEEHNSEQVIEKRKEDVFNFIKEKKDWIVYVALGLIVWLSVFIRTRNLYGLKDVTTNSWTLGPDLDPFLFLRWAKYIVEHGSLMVIDTMRYVPLGYDTSNEMGLLPHMIVWLYDIMKLFSSEVTITYAAVIFPVVAFALTVIAFFFLVRRIFYNSFNNKVYPSVIALVASFFLSVLPSMLPRTIAGIPEKESIAFLFLFLAFYFFIGAWRSKSQKGQIISSILAGASTALMALIWGGYGYIFFVISFSVLVCLILGQMNFDKAKVHGVWLLSSFVLMMPFSGRYTPYALLSSFTTASSILVFFMCVVYLVIKKTKLKEYFKKGYLSKVPLEISSVVATLLVVVVLASVLFGPTFVFSEADNIYHQLVKPATSRLIQTVAENRQPDFKEWSSSFGPVVKNLPLFFWLFMIAAITLFYSMIKRLKLKERVYLMIGFVVFLFAIIFSRYSSSGLLNGENFVSLFVYFGGMAIFAIIFGKTYYDIYKSNEIEKFKSMDFGLILLMSFFVLGIISARGLVRLIMMLVPVTSALVGYLVVKSSRYSFRALKKDKINWFLVIVSLLLIVSSIYSGFYLYKQTVNEATGFIPNQYTNQWQKAMAWVRDNTSEDAVFGHWWDYGYWIQSIGNRATILDGGNAIGYWNYMMGRYVLTSPSDKEALEFMYAHNGTHFLIDSTDIGKYSAYSKIGSDENWDRISFIPTTTMNTQQTLELSDGTIYTYNLGVGLDEDIVWEVNGTKEFFPQETSGIAGFKIKFNSNGKIVQADMVVARLPSTQISIPIKYVYYNGELTEFKNGYNAGVFLMDYYSYDNGQVGLTAKGSGFYLSNRVIDSFLVRKYLFGEEGDFKLVHQQESEVVESLRQNGVDVSSFAYFNGNFLGPIKIWEVDYPANIEFNEEYLRTEYPANLL